VRSLGRFLQLLGLLILPVGLIYGATSGKDDALRVEFMSLALGALLFLMGTSLARKGS
jgi:hypothetical protein